MLLDRFVAIKMKLGKKQPTRTDPAVDSGKSTLTDSDARFTRIPGANLGLSIN